MSASSKIPDEIKYIIGVDEVGRGPLAGPITVGAFCIKKDFNQKLLKGVDSSKKLTRAQRENWAKILHDLEKKKQAHFTVSSVGAPLIDRLGISKATKIAMKRALDNLPVNPGKSFLFLDGALFGPKMFKFQKTIIRGDEKVGVISCASILAKVKRDAAMQRLSKIFPEYNFEIHKGYGTKAHFKMIKTHGLCEIHRRSFLKDYIK